MNNLAQFVAQYGPLLVAGTTLLLAIGCAGVALTRSSAHRQRLGEMTVAAVLVWLTLALVPLPRLMPEASERASPDFELSIVNRRMVPQTASQILPLPLGEGRGEGPRAFGAPPQSDVSADEPHPDVLVAERSGDPVEEAARAELGKRDGLSMTIESETSDPPIVATVAERPAAAAAATDYSAIAAELFLIGAAACIAWLFVGHMLLARIRWRGRLPEPWLVELFQALATHRGPRAQLIVSGGCPQAMSWGVISPVIVLPEALCRSDNQFQLRAVLLHELAHVARRDAWGNLLISIALPILYWQPLFWWLRAQVRLSAEIVADDWASRETGSNREDYARELIALAKMASRRWTPLVGAAGVFSSTSQFYRRMHMLLTRETPLAIGLSWRWKLSATFSMCTIVALAAATAGVRPAAGRQSASAIGAEVGSSQRESSSAAVKSAERSRSTDTAAEAPRRKPGPGDKVPVLSELPIAGKLFQKTGTHRSDESGSAEASSGKAARAEAVPQKLLDGLFARATAIKSGRFRVKHQKIENGKVVLETPAEYVVSGESWRERPRPSAVEGIVIHGGRLLILRQPPVAQMVGRPPPLPEYLLTIQWPQPVTPARGGAVRVPVDAGTIWYPETIPWLQEHAGNARLARTESVNGVETQVIEWPVRARDAAAAFLNFNSLLAGGGTYRVYVAPQIGYAAARIEFVDRFATPQYVFDFAEFKQVGAGLYFPMKIRIQEKQEKGIAVEEVASVNEPIDDREFGFRIPPGTHVQDLRPHRGDPRAPFGHVVPHSEHSLRNFKTGAEYPEGLPAAMLAEMDRDVISPDEFRREEAVSAAATEPVEKESAAIPSQPPAEPAEPQPARRFNQGQLLYGGKDFEHWRIQLLTDLEPETRVKAMEALGAFAAYGYAEKTAASISEALKNEDPTLAGGKVQDAACAALERCGKAGIPVLEGQLKSGDPRARVNAVKALARLASSTETVIPGLLAASKDKAVVVRGIAFPALAARFLTDPLVASTVALAVNDEPSVRSGVVDGLCDSTAPADQVAALVRAYLKDDNMKVRATAAAVFAARAPGSAENIALLQAAVLKTGYEGRTAFVESLMRQQTRIAAHPDLTVPVLAWLLDPDGTYNESDHPLRETTDLEIFDLIAMVASDNTAHAAIPALIQAVREELSIKFLPGLRRSRADDLETLRLKMVFHAAEALGRFGPAARAGLPALKGLLEPARVNKNVLNELGLETEKQWRTRIEAVIRKIEGEPEATTRDAVRILLGNFSLSNTSAAPGMTIHFDFKASVAAASGRSSNLEENLKVNTARIRMAMDKIIRGANLEELNDPELVKIRQRIRDDVNHLLRASDVSAVVITDVRIIEQ